MECSFFFQRTINVIQSSDEEEPSEAEESGKEEDEEDEEDGEDDGEEEEDDGEEEDQENDVDEKRKPEENGKIKRETVLLSIIFHFLVVVFLFFLICR